MSMNLSDKVDLPDQPVDRLDSKGSDLSTHLWAEIKNEALTDTSRDRISSSAKVDVLDFEAVDIYKSSLNDALQPSGADKSPNGSDENPVEKAFANAEPFMRKAGGDPTPSLPLDPITFINPGDVRDEFPPSIPWIYPHESPPFPEIKFPEIQLPEINLPEIPRLDDLPLLPKFHKSITRNEDGQITDLTQGDGRSFHMQYNGKDLASIRQGDQPDFVKTPTGWEQQQPDGTVVHVKDIKVSDNGDVTWTTDSGETKTSHHDGSFTDKGTNGSSVTMDRYRRVTETTTPGGVTTRIQYGGPDGQPTEVDYPGGLTYKKGDNGKWGQYQNGELQAIGDLDVRVTEDGSVAVKYADGSAIITHPDGSVERDEGPASREDIYKPSLNDASLPSGADRLPSGSDGIQPASLDSYVNGSVDEASATVESFYRKAGGDPNPSSVTLEPVRRSDPGDSPNNSLPLDKIAITEDPWNQSKDFWTINEIFEQAARLVPEVIHPSITYNINGKPTEVTQAGGLHVSVEYDKQGNQVQVEGNNITWVKTPPNGWEGRDKNNSSNVFHAQEIKVSDNGDITNIGPNGEGRIYHYDGSITTIKDGAKVTCDKDGRVTETTNPRGETTKIHYDGPPPDGKPVEVVNPDGTTLRRGSDGTWTHYDKQGNADEHMGEHSVVVTKEGGVGILDKQGRGIVKFPNGSWKRID